MNPVVVRPGDVIVVLLHSISRVTINFVKSAAHGFGASRAITQPPTKKEPSLFGSTRNRSVSPGPTSRQLLQFHLLTRQSAGGGRHVLEAAQLGVFDGDLHRLAFVELTFENLFRQAIFQEALDGPAHGARG